MEKRVVSRWTGAMDFAAENESGATIALSDRTTEFRPSVLMLAALASCTGMDAISVMTKKRLQVTRYEVEAVGRQRDDHPRSFVHIVVIHLVDGISLEDAAVRRAIELSARKYCMVGANLASGETSINHRLRAIDEHGERTYDCLTIGPHGQGLAHLEAGRDRRSTA
jgi:putative redox protein